MKRIIAVSVAALVISAAIPLSAFAQTDRSNYRAHGAHHRVNDFDRPDAGPNGYGFYPDAPGYSYAPQGGNSGGANFPHSGT